MYCGYSATGVLPAVTTYRGSSSTSRKKGDKVKVGTKIAEAGGPVSAPIHSSVSGTVAKVGAMIDATGYSKPVIIINVEDDVWEEFIDRSDKLEPLDKHDELTPDEIIRRIKDAGITGMGGAGFLHM